ncbi:MAG: hypothetical protein V7646_5838 [Pseudonocardia sp.]|jgi:hypothetical protein
MLTEPPVSPAARAVADVVLIQGPMRQWPAASFTGWAPG